uniref:Uncharacterized protein n=1 Tax=Caenorhabditis japonica TaxID=281687 RepID=A0A8R1IKP5_CAEJA
MAKTITKKIENLVDGRRQKRGEASVQCLISSSSSTSPLLRHTLFLLLLLECFRPKTTTATNRRGNR